MSRPPRTLRAAVPLAVILAMSLVLGLALWLTGAPGAVADPLHHDADSAVSRPGGPMTVPRTGGTGLSAAAAAPEAEGGSPHGAGLIGEGPVTTCRVPAVRIPHSPGCSWTDRYPSCRYQLPDPERAGHLYSRWRLTDEDRWWGSPGLVTLLLAVAADYARAYPGEAIVIGDLDAPGPRHATHRDGVDVDMYLPGMMAVDNPGGYEYPDNYEGRSRLAVWARRTRVVDLARILTSCTGGRLRIYYNDPPAERRFLRWFDARGFHSPFGRPMVEHNDLHRFHFHVSIPHGMDPLPTEGQGT